MKNRRFWGARLSAHLQRRKPQKSRFQAGHRPHLKRKSPSNPNSNPEANTLSAMNINPVSTARKAAYPTLASLAAGAFMLTGSACQPQRTAGQYAAEAPLSGGSVAPPEKSASSAQEPQRIIGKARIDPQTGKRIEPGTKTEPRRLGGRRAADYRKKSSSKQ